MTRWNDLERMNIFLAITMATFNYLLAFGIFAVAVLGIYLLISGDVDNMTQMLVVVWILLQHGLQTRVGVAITIAVIALFIAAYLCGIVAILCLIEKHLRELRKQRSSRITRNNNADDAHPRDGETRITPRLARD